MTSMSQMVKSKVILVVFHGTSLLYIICIHTSLIDFRPIRKVSFFDDNFIKLYNRNNLIDVKKSVLSNCNEKE